MREIKFRAKRVDTGEWVYGFYVKNNDGRISTGISSIFTGQCGYGFSSELIYERCEVIPETVGQFIGRKDVKGKEAYEGDICETIERDVAFEIKWNQEVCAFMFWENQHEMWFDINGLANMEITSSIHDNPELLK